MCCYACACMLVHVRAVTRAAQMRASATPTLLSLAPVLCNSACAYAHIVVTRAVVRIPGFACQTARKQLLQAQGVGSFSEQMRHSQRERQTASLAPPSARIARLGGTPEAAINACLRTHNAARPAEPQRRRNDCAPSRAAARCKSVQGACRLNHESM